MAALRVLAGGGIVCVLGIVLAGMLQPSKPAPDSGLDPTARPAVSASASPSRDEGAVTLSAYWPRGVDVTEVRISVGIGGPLAFLDPIPKTEVAYVGWNVQRWRWQRSVPAEQVKGKRVYLVIRGPRSENGKYTCEMRAQDGSGDRQTYPQSAGCDYKF